MKHVSTDIHLGHGLQQTQPSIGNMCRLQYYKLLPQKASLACPLPLAWLTGGRLGNYWDTLLRRPNLLLEYLTGVAPTDPATAPVRNILAVDALARIFGVNLCTRLLIQYDD